MINKRPAMPPATALRGRAAAVLEHSPTSLGDAGPGPPCSSWKPPGDHGRAGRSRTDIFRQVDNHVQSVLGKTFVRAEFLEIWNAVADAPAHKQSRIMDAWLRTRMWQPHPSEHPLFARYKPTLIGAGGMQAVYATERHPDIVFKIDTAQIRRLVAYNAQFSGRRVNLIPDALPALLEDALAKERQQASRLAEYFPGHVLGDRLQIATVPVPGRALQHLLSPGLILEQRHSQLDCSGLHQPPKFSLDECHGIRTILRVQKRSDRYAQDDVLDIQSSFAEKLWSTPGLRPEDYMRANQLWLEDAGPGYTPFDRELFCRVQSTRRGVLERLLKRADEDPALRAALADFALSAARYAETGMHLEIAGQRNVLFYPEGRRWNYLLADAQYSSCVPVLKLAGPILQMIADGKQPNLRQASVLLNAMNYVRTINGILHYLGKSEHRIRLPNMPAPGSLRWDAVYQWTRSRAKPRTTDLVPFLFTPSWRGEFLPLELCA